MFCRDIYVENMYKSDLKVGERELECKVISTVLVTFKGELMCKQ